ncbi:MAG: DUF1566 domain-containing protein [Deltaproteobacteria bacterium]|nr:DUF1566 domain-containing protein [Deltaproteobacteria bacterium]
MNLSATTAGWSWLAAASCTLVVVAAGCPVTPSNDDSGHNSGDSGGTTACQTADDCPAGQGCRPAEGECAPCRVAGECRSGEACDDGVCGNCTIATQCDGLLCNSNGVCVACQPGTDDAACAAAYSDAEFRCNSDGTCGPHTCTSTADCQIERQICSPQGRCVACEFASDCLAAGYPAGTLCVDDQCKGADCITSADCLTDKPICGSDSRCRGCQTPLECTLALQVEAVCETATGLCHTGNCSPNNTACGTPTQDQVCVDYVCTPCNGTPQCQTVFGAGFLCLAGHCRGGNCQIDAECEGGQRICGDDNYCRNCILGSDECGVDRVCGSDGRCHDGDCYPPSTECCDATGHFQPETYRCSDIAVATGYQCAGNECGADAQSRRSFRHCTGHSGTCDLSNLQWELDWGIHQACESNQLCNKSETGAWCTTCDHGCGGSACWPECNPATEKCCSTTGTRYGCWYDSTSQIEWQEPPTTTQMTFQEAATYCRGLVHGGYDDWNVPSISELRSLVRGCSLTVSGGDCGVTDGCYSTAPMCYNAEECNAGTPPTCGPFGGPGTIGCYMDPALAGSNGICDKKYWSCAHPSNELWTVNFATATVALWYAAFDANVRCLRGGICH